jgi:O-methyltransferase involved in polyketide biosynthesis
MEALDAVIQGTAEDALIAKHAAVEAGYYDDPYIHAFPHKHRHVQPIIKRGTHARVCCIDRSITAFMRQCQARANESTSVSRVQIVILGAGKDTSFFRLAHYLSGCIWYEVDHGKVITDKIDVIQSSMSIFDATISRVEDGYTISKQGSTCHIISHDLRSDTALLLQKLTRLGFDSQTPTLFVLECVLMYLPESSCRALLSHLSAQCPQSCLCCYEPILGNDPFGRMMDDNLSKAGMVQHDSCLIQTRTLMQQRDKLIKAGWSRVAGCRMDEAYGSVLTGEQRQRANQSEFLDELEEWQLIMRHYCFVVAAVESSAIGNEYCATGPESAVGIPSSSV